MQHSHSGHPVEGIPLKCEHCGETFVYELSAPMAVRCTECDGVFDARLSIVKRFKGEWKKVIGAK